MIDTPADMRPTRWLWIAAIWCAGGLLDASQTVLVVRAEGTHHAGLTLFATELVSWVPWVLATPLVIRLARRHPLIRVTTLPAAALHLAAFVIVSLIAAAWSALLQVLFNPWEHPLPQGPFIDVWRTWLLYQVLTFLFVYVLIVAITAVADSRESMARQRTETARLNEELSKAQLAALRRQMEPHFMFNALNSIAALVRDHRSEAAVKVIVGLSEFLRRASEDSHRSQVTLAEEVEYLTRYLDIQKVRFGERLQVNVDIPPDLLQAQVPNLLLQPLVENAIKHGVAKRLAGGTIRVTGARRNGTLCLSVHNDGPSLPADWQATHNGIGIDNLRTRLQILHGSDSALQLRNTDTGVDVLVTLPLREQ
ncbi:MAG: histidine kinase [Steroidobacteraceae bacterium]